MKQTTTHLLRLTFEAKPPAAGLDRSEEYIFSLRLSR